MPTSVKHIQQGLEPYIRERQETSRVRKILATFLSSQVLLDEASISPPLSLVNIATTIKSPSGGVRGVRKEYIRCVQANIKAQREYESVKLDHRSPIDNDKLRSHPSRGCDDPGENLVSFLEVIKLRRKHERLRVIQDYTDKLAQRPAAAVSHPDLNFVLKDMQSLPKVPQEVMNASGSRHDSEGTDIRLLVEHLEKSVLRAKLLLKKERKLLVKVKSGEAAADHCPVRRCSRLEALGSARNDLINWIETELARAGENSEDSEEGQDRKIMEKKDKHYLESQPAMIQKRYMQYTKARQNLILTVITRLEPPISTVSDAEAEQLHGEDKMAKTNALSHITYPYLDELALISNEQKFIIQQKSRVTISLAKQLKEAGQGLDRLAEESHLLPAHPIPSGSSRRRGPASFADEISNSEKPNSSRRAQAWVFASDASTSASRDTILQSLEEGEKSTSDAQKFLMGIYELLGEEMSVGTRVQPGEVTTKPETRDIWSQLDGQLGAIKTDDMT